MRGAIPPFPQYVFMAWCSVKAQGQLTLYIKILSTSSPRNVSEFHCRYQVHFINFPLVFVASHFDYHIPYINIGHVSIPH
jgi:hypothetical protein